MPTWIAIDWEKTWEDGLSWDYTFYDGYRILQPLLGQFRKWHIGGCVSPMRYYN